MSSLGTYTFLPWLRQGLANQISGPAAGEIRATIEVGLSVEGTKVDGGTEITPPLAPKTIEIYGPGDIIGIDKKAIFKVEPRNWITNFEPNYMPYIEFYDEDLPWRYSPHANPTSGNHQLVPWIMLIVLEESEFTDGKNIKDRPLPYIQLNADAKLPPPEESWAWAHVHLNQSLMAEILSTDTNAIQSNVETLLNSNPDLGFSRIVCPRKLDEKKAYHAFLVPVFESGRLAGIGDDPSTATKEYAWNPESPDTNQLPFYHRWYFRTGTIGDFEYLVRLLEPKPADSRVGLRDMDVQDPGANLKGISDANLQGILKLGGALRVPDINYTPDEFAEVVTYREWAEDPYPHPFQTSLAAFINLSDSYEKESASTANQNADIDEKQPAINPETDYDIGQNPDPLITAPLYGQWHALTQRLLKERDDTNIDPDDNWVHELNLDPRWRVAAGFGTKVVQQNQEDYMKSAWDQVGEIVEANRRIREAQMAKAAASVWYNNHLTIIRDRQQAQWLSISAPLHTRVMAQGITVGHHVKTSLVPKAAISVNMRKSLRPRGKLVKRLPFSEEITPDNLIERINAGEVSAAPPRTTPEGINSLEEYADELRPNNVPDWIINLLERYPWIKWLVLGLTILMLILLALFRSSIGFVAVGTAIVGGLVYLYRLISNWSKQIKEAEAIQEENMSPEAVDELPNSPDFQLVEIGDSFKPSIGRTDSIVAQRFKTALKDVYGTVNEATQLGTVPVKPSLNIGLVSQATFEQVNPSLTIPRWTLGGIQIPARIREAQIEEFIEAMAYPEFDLPMYKPLADHSAELFLPNINFVAQNSISLLETNQKFIEAYMVGLNHEFARELLWREYPTDQRGSYFRQFWDVSSFLSSDENIDEETLREQLKDIPPLHRWPKASELGEHDHREADGESEEEVVLVIRGELLKKYPTAVIYAHRAIWQDEDNNPTSDPSKIDPTKERTLMPIPVGQENNPPRDIIKMPLYEAKVDPDIYFFGFDLTACVAKGGTGDEDIEVDARCKDENVEWFDPGWFFVIKERPGEPRFGLDIGPEDSQPSDFSDVKVWNDLSWPHILPQVDKEHIKMQGATSITLDPDPNNLPTEEKEKSLQLSEDKDIDWTANMNAAELAYVLYQVPVLVGIHASEMLPDSPSS